MIRTLKHGSNKIYKATNRSRDKIPPWGTPASKSRHRQELTADAFEDRTKTPPKPRERPYVDERPSWLTVLKALEKSINIKTITLVFFIPHLISSVTLRSAVMVLYPGLYPDWKGLMREFWWINWVYGGIFTMWFKLLEVVTGDVGVRRFS